MTVSQPGPANPFTGQGVPSRSAWHTLLGLWPLFLSVGIVMLANGLQGTLLAVRATLEGFSTAVTGIVMAGYFVGVLIGSGPSVWLVGRVGHVRVFAGLASLASVTILVQGLFVDPVLWTVMRIVNGFCYAGLFVVTESWLNEQCTNATRGKTLASYMVLVFSGMAVGQFLLPWADPRDLDLFIVVSALVSLAVVPMVLAHSPAPSVKAARRLGLLVLYRISPLGVGCAVAAGMAYSGLFGLGAVYAAAIGLGSTEIAAFMAAPLVGALLLQLPIGRYSDRFDRRYVLVALAGLACVASLLGLQLEGGGLAGLLVVGFLLGGASLPLYALGIAHTNDYLSPAQSVDASGTLVLAGGLGLSVGPLIVAGWMTLAGPSGFFAFMVAVHAAIGLFALYRMTRRVALPVEEQSPYIPAVMRGSSVTTQLALVEMNAELRSQENPAPVTTAAR